MKEKQKIAILGSTGSIGKACLGIVARYPQMFEVTALACGENIQLLNEQIAKFSPKYVFCKSHKDIVGEVKILPTIEDIASIEEVDSILFATVGFTSASAVISAIKLGKKIMLANKETLVCAGDIIMPLVKKYNATFIPVDSEHSAIWQVSRGDINRKIRKIILTASGGAFRDFDKSKLQNVTYRDALKHPNWSMGKKITIDCASLVNKALEVIEAHHLFSLDYSDIDYVMHRQSIIHSMIELDDSSVLAQMSYPTMEIPISLALSYPTRLQTTVKSMDFCTLKSIDFEPLPRDKFPCFDMVVDAGKAGGIMPTAVNAANEILVDYFLREKIKFIHFADVLSDIMSKTVNVNSPTLENIFSCDIESRKITKDIINSKYLE